MSENWKRPNGSNPPFSEVRNVRLPDGRPAASAPVTGFGPQSARSASGRGRR
jgi:hypothetical protein